MTIHSKGSKILAKQIVRRTDDGQETQNQGEGVYHTISRVRICFRREHVIGAGSFGVVQTVNIYKIMDENGYKRLPDKGLRYAMKTIKVKRKECRELDILRSVDHVNIVTLRYYFYNHEKETGELKLNLLFDLHHTSLHDLINQLYDDEETLEESTIAAFAFQILKGLEYLHEHDIAHRDLKPRNLLINMESNALQICDLGSACRLNTEGLGELNPYICSRFYRAPELLLGSTQYSTKVDIWSFGCVLGEMCLLEALIPGCDTGDQIGEVLDLLGPPSLEDIDGMGLKQSSIYCTIGGLYNRVKCEVSIEEKLEKQITGARDLVESDFIQCTVDMICCTLLYNPESRQSATQLTNHELFQYYL